MNNREKRLSAAQLRLRQHHPFFAMLGLFVPVELTDEVDTAATDGKNVLFNPRFIDNIDGVMLDAVLLHEVLHAALLHVPRSAGRDMRCWNYAADIVVNGMVRAQGLALPKGALTRKEWENYSVEEIYHILITSRATIPRRLHLDLYLPRTDGATGGSAMERHQRATLEGYWKNARMQAEIIARKYMSKHGNQSLGFGREWNSLNHPLIDWKGALWRFLVRTPTDFSGYDRRFIYRGIYLEAMEGESLRVWIAVDTSASIGKVELDVFYSEILGILRTYPHIECQLFFADAGLHGPYVVGTDSTLPVPRGGGGTSFVPFFSRVSETPENERPDVCIYLTDGHGDFPQSKPRVPVMWIVVVPGLSEEMFPFGEVIRLVHG